MDEFGRTEVDPDSLERLFALDHLAARMRRNEENLLVLGGGEPYRRISRPVAVADLLRAAAQEIDHYRRIEISYSQDFFITAHAAGDVIHLLAELLENATQFSPPSSTVRVHAQPWQTGFTITVIDRGIGMPPEQLADANERLHRPAALTSALVGTMGLLVVARLAQRHGLSVHLASRPAAGTVATVALPDACIALPAIDGLTRSVRTATTASPPPGAAIVGRARARRGPPDPEAVRLRLSSLAQGLAAGGRAVKAPTRPPITYEERR
jgi:signal transduction histidine kinase